MTTTAKQEAVEALRQILLAIERTPQTDEHELLRLAALATWQLNRLTASPKNIYP